MSCFFPSGSNSNNCFTLTFQNTQQHTWEIMLKVPYDAALTSSVNTLVRNEKTFSFTSFICASADRSMLKHRPGIQLFVMSQRAFGPTPLRAPRGLPCSHSSPYKWKVQQTFSYCSELKLRVLAGGCKRRAKWGFLERLHQGSPGWKIKI